MKNIGKVLRIARIANDLTLKEAGSRSGVSYAYISELERQVKTNVSDEILEKLAKAYNLTKSQIITLEESYNILPIPEKRIFSRTLLNVLMYMESNSNKE